MPDLHVLSLRDCKRVAFDGVRLPQSFALRSLDVKGTSVSSRGLAVIAVMSQLQRLDLSYTDVTDGALPTLSLRRSDFGPLTKVNLRGTRITDVGLVSLPFGNFRELNLSDTEITDAGIQKLGQARGLRFIDVRETKVTDEGRTSLKRLSPELKFADEAGESKQAFTIRN